MTEWTEFGVPRRDCGGVLWGEVVGGGLDAVG